MCLEAEIEESKNILHQLLKLKNRNGDVFEKRILKYKIVKAKIFLVMIRVMIISFSLLA